VEFSKRLNANLTYGKSTGDRLNNVLLNRISDTPELIYHWIILERRKFEKRVQTQQGNFAGCLQHYASSFR
jgi:hypothetical protein